MSRTYDVYGVGNALVDIQYVVEPETLQKLEIDKGIMTLVDQERQRQITEALDAKPVNSASGGSAANTMIGVAQFGGRPYYACQLGNDSWGDFYQLDLHSAGVATNPDNRGDGPTGQCLVMITPDADRTLNTFLGISGELDASQIEEEIVADSQFVYLEGYLLTSDNGDAACRRSQELARKHGTGVSLTLSDPAIVDFCRERFDHLVAAGIDLLFCNEEEARAFTGADDRDASCDRLADMVTAAWITCGADGAILVTNGGRELIPSTPVTAVDTTGAGDLFAGGVLFGLTNTYSDADAGRLGAYAAAQVVSQYGPRLEQPLAKAIPTILA